MKINKKLKTALKIAGGAVLLFFIVLVTHIVIMVKNRPPLVHSTTQLARADFKQPVDSAAAISIQDGLKKLSGVQTTYFNLKDNILVYGFDNRKNTAENIYDEAIKNCGFTSVRYMVNSKDMANGCPVIDNNSFYGKVTNVIAKIVN